MDLISRNYFSRYEPGIFESLLDSLLRQGDTYMRLADLRSYLEADRALRVQYSDRDGWARKAILKIAASGPFSSDETISRYAAEFWRATPCPVPL